MDLNIIHHVCPVVLHVVERAAM